MKKTIAIRIPEPCHEDWVQMTPTQKGKNCSICEKEVIDFTAHTKEQLYKRVAGGSNMCGRFRNDQLDTPISLHRYKGRSFAQYAASLLVPAALFSAEGVSAQESTEFFTTGEIAPVEMTSKKYDSLGIGALSRKQKTAATLLTIKGVVTEEHGPLPGARIEVKSTKRKAISDFDGNYAIDVYPGETLVYSFIGFETKEILVGSQLKINVLLEADRDMEFTLTTVGVVFIADHKEFKKEKRKEKRQKKKIHKQ